MIQGLQRGTWSLKNLWPSLVMQAKRKSWRSDDSWKSQSWFQNFNISSTNLQPSSTHPNITVTANPYTQCISKHPASSAVDGAKSLTPCSNSVVDNCTGRKLQFEYWVNSESILFEHLNSMPCHPGSHPWDWTGLWCLVLTVAPVWKQTLNDMNSYDSKGLTGFQYISLMSLLQRTVNERIKCRPTRKCGTHVNTGTSGPGSATPGDAKCRKVLRVKLEVTEAKVSNSGTRDRGINEIPWPLILQSWYSSGVRPRKFLRTRTL